MKVCFNGRLEEEDVGHSVSVFSDVLQFGKAVFETLRTYDSDRVFALEAHLDRLFQSAVILKLDLRRLSVLDHEWRERGDLRMFMGSCVQRLVDQNRVRGKDLRIKIFLTETFFWIRTEFLEVMPEAFYRDGVRVEEAVFERCFPRAKYPNPAYHYFRAIRSEKSWETICFSADGFLREGSISNVFAVFGNEVITPRDGVLLGVTREKVLGIIRQLGLKAVEQTISRERLLEADEIFLTCTSNEVVSVNVWSVLRKGGEEVVWSGGNFKIAHRLLKRTVNRDQ